LKEMCRWCHWEIDGSGCPNPQCDTKKTNAVPYPSIAVPHWAIKNAEAGKMVIIGYEHIHCPLGASLKTVAKGQGAFVRIPGAENSVEWKLPAPPPFLAHLDRESKVDEKPQVREFVRAYGAYYDINGDEIPAVNFVWLRTA
jgi:hypothetical protein